MKLINTILRNSPPYIYTLVILLAICWLTLVPKPLPDTDFQLFPGADKVAHFVLFGAFAGAFFIDMMRAGKKRSAVLCACIAGVISIILGAGVELFQYLMGAGRSAETADFVADAAGAIVVATAFYFIDRKYFNFVSPKCIKCTDSDENDLKELKKIYMKAFPPEERRDWDDIMSRSHSIGSPMSMTMVMMGNSPAGFITSWNLGNFVYIEHFVIDPMLRNRGIGIKALREFCTAANMPVVLEVERASAGETARRRIRFYERLNFHPYRDFNYIQPPYAPGLPEVPLMLMSTSKSLNPEEISLKLHKIVYEQD